MPNITLSITQSEFDAIDAFREADNAKEGATQHADVDVYMVARLRNTLKAEINHRDRVRLDRISQNPDQLAAALVAGEAVP